MRSLIVVATVPMLLVVVPQTAIAQDATTGLRGFRLEVNGGDDRYRSAFDHRSKFGYGATVGLDGMLGDRIVVGVEGSYWRPEHDSTNCEAGTAGTICNASRREFGAAGRIGYLVSPQLLAFVKGGYVNDKERNAFSASNNLYYVNGVITPPPSSYVHSYSTDGYQVGAGVEYSLTTMFYVSGQYVYSRYNNDTSRQRAMLGVGVRLK